MEIIIKGDNIILRSELIKGFDVRLRVKVCIKNRMNENINTVPGDIKEECNLDNHVYDYLREFEKEGVIEVERDNNKYIDIRLTKKGLRQLNDQMLAPYSNDVRNIVLRIDENGIPIIVVDDNLINVVLSIKQELIPYIVKVIPQMFGTVIPNDFSNQISPKLEEFFDNKFVNLNKISQN